MLARRSLVVPLILIGIGVVALLANLGLVSRDAIDRAGALWPLILVFIGAELILRRVLPPQSASVAGMVLLVGLLVVVVAYAALGPTALSGSRTVDSQAPRQELTRVALALDLGGAQLDVRAASLGDDLYRVHADYPAAQGAPVVSLDRAAGRLKVEQSHPSSVFPFGLSGRTQVQVQLNDQVAWEIDLSGGAFNGTIDTGTQVTGMQVSGGAANLDIRLGAPRGTVALDFSGGAFNITIHVPGGTELQVSASGGANEVEVAGHHLGAFGQDTYSSTGYSSAGDRYTISLSGGASHARVVND